MESAIEADGLVKSYPKGVTALDETAERPATTAQFTGLKSATRAIQPGMMFAARNVVERNVSGSRMNCVAPISASSSD